MDTFVLDLSNLCGKVKVCLIIEIYFFFPNDYEENDKIIPKFFSITKKMKKIYCIICGKYRKFEKPKISYLIEKTLVLSII